MSISISVQNQSMRDLGIRGIVSSDASQSMALREIYSGPNPPVDIQILDKTLEEEAREKKEKEDQEQEALEKQTLSMSAGHIASQLKGLDPTVGNSKEFSNSQENSSNQEDQSPNAQQLQSQYGSNLAGPQNMLDVDMTAQQNADWNSRPASQYAGRPGQGKHQHNDVRVRKKRVKSTRPGGIRGGVLIQDRFTVQTPQNNKKSRLASLKKLAYNDQSLTGGQSTKAGASSIHNQSSMLYKSYAPTGLVKVGTKSVQRLRPRIPYDSSYNTSGANLRPTTAAVRPLQTGPQGLSSEYASVGTLNQTMVKGVSNLRPQSQISHQPRVNKLASMNMTMSNSNIIQQNYNSLQSQNTYGMADFNNTTEENPMTTTMGEFAETQGILQNHDGFKLVSQFESEQAAMQYASELQKYYDGINMDVKVQIESNLEEMDDTEGQVYIAQAKHQHETEREQRSLIQEMSRDQTQAQKRIVNFNVKHAFNCHFQKNEKVQKNKAKKRLEKKADIAQTKFEKRINTKPVTKEQREYQKLNKLQIKEVHEAQNQIYGVIKDTTQMPELGYQNINALYRKERDPYFRFDREAKSTQVNQKSNFQAQILNKLGILKVDLKGETPHASQVMSGDGKIPKSRAKFHQREQRFKKQFQAKCEQWQKMDPQNGTITDTMSSVQLIEGQEVEQFDVDVRLYKERGDNYQVIGNKMQYRASEQTTQGHNYSNKQAMDTKSSFDPIRIRLRIMPISRAPLAQGKTPDFYFIEAAKKSLSGDLTSAVESLKRGLMINPKHFICRFNHGVLMFKFGLIREARKDFEELTQHPHGMKDAWVFYNLATCLIQTAYPEWESQNVERRRQAMQRNQAARRLSSIQGGFMGDFVKQIQQTIHVKPDKGTDNYSKAILMCEKSYQLGGSDKLIKLDALKLKGVCLFRLGRLIDSVGALAKAKILEAQIQEEEEERKRKTILQNTDDEIIGSYFTRKDFIMIRRYQKRSNSFLHKRHIRMRPPQRSQIKRDLSWTTFEVTDKRIQKEQDADDEPSNASELGKYASTNDNGDDSSDKTSTTEEKKTSNKLQSSQGQSNTSEHSRASHALARTKELVENEFDSGDNKSRALNRFADKLGISSGQGSPSKRRSAKGSRQTSGDLKKQGSSTNSAHLRISSANRTVKGDKQIRFDLPSAEEDSKAKFKQGLMHGMMRKINQVAKKMQAPRKMNNTKIDALMNKMKAQQAELAEDRKQLRLSKHQYAIFRRTYIEERKKSDKVVDEQTPMLRLKNIYLREWAEDEAEFEDCNIYERNELMKRREIDKWLSDDLISKLIEEAAKKLNKMGEVGVDPVEAELNTRFVEQLLQVAEVNLAEVDGTHCENLIDIIKDQSQMDDIMIELRDKVSEMCRQFENELRRGIEELNSQVPKLAEMKILRGEKHTTVEDEQLGIEDNLITRLRDALNNDASTPDEVINVLTTDCFEKEKQKLTIQYMNGGSDDESIDEDKIFTKRKLIANRNKNKQKASQENRYTERHIEQIRNQYKLRHSERDYKVLDVMMRHLRFIKRHEKDVRYQILKNAEFIEIPAQQIIFHKGDTADYMYIILKGRVSCESNISQYNDIPIILATCKDGEAIGELAVIDNDTLHHQSTIEVRDAQNSGEKVESHDIYEKTRKRMATCKTVEKTLFLRILASEAKQIIQPTLKKEQEMSTMSHGHSQAQLQQSRELKSIESANNNSLENMASTEPKDYQADELNSRLQFLQNFSLFKGLAPEVLMPVAVNMTVVRFSYGEFLAKEGEVPAGMYIIKSGQCIVGQSRLASRPKNYRDIPGQRKPVNDKYALFDKFDPENSLLNNVKMPDRVFQNQRIYVENDQQIRDKILYHDFVQFSKLFPNKQFGGRRLLPFELYMQLKRIYFGAESLKKPDNEPSGDIRVEEKYQMKSFLDIVADSACVEAYLITKQGIQYLSEKYLTSVYESIVQEKEPDRPTTQDKINEKRDEMLSSQAQSIQLVKKLMWNHKIEKYGVNALGKQAPP